MSKRYVFLTVSTEENGELYVHDQDGRIVEGVFAISTSVDAETPRTAGIKFYCKNGDGNLIPPNDMTA